MNQQSFKAVHEAEEISYAEGCVSQRRQPQGVLQCDSPLPPVEVLLKLEMFCDYLGQLKAASGEGS